MPAEGIVRPARRPAGWIAPGPPPAAPPDRPELWPGPEEDLCHLAGDWRILQRLDGHRWSLDDLVTAWVAAEQSALTSPTRIADLGCGIGAVLLMLAWRFPLARCLGVEAQVMSVSLARRSLAWNGAAQRCEVRLGDLRDETLLPSAAFDLVTATPPYLRPGSATESRRVQRGPCTFEHRGGIEAYCRAAARLLAPTGWFVTCAAAGHTDRLRTAAGAAGLDVARRLDVIPRAGKAALFSVHAMRRADSVAAVADDALVVRDAEGRRTAAFRAVRRAMGMPP